MNVVNNGCRDSGCRDFGVDPLWRHKSWLVVVRDQFILYTLCFTLSDARLLLREHEHDTRRKRIYSMDTRIFTDSHADDSDSLGDDREYTDATRLRRRTNDALTSHVTRR